MMKIKSWDCNYLSEKRETINNPFDEKKKPYNFERIIDVKIPTVVSKSGPPFGPALAQCGVNVTNFCETFNEITEDLDILEDLEIPVRVFLKKEKTFDFICKPLPLFEMVEIASYWLKGEKELNQLKEIWIQKVLLVKLLFLKDVKSGRKARRRIKMRKRFHYKVQKKLKRGWWVDFLDLFKIYKIQEDHLSFYPNYTKVGLLRSILSFFKKEKISILISDNIIERKEYIRKKYYVRFANISNK